MSKRTLDIIVTHYNEPWEVVRPFFDILGAQKSVDFSKIKVWLIQDGPCVSIFPPGYFVGSPLGHSIENFETVTIPHGGVSAARNAGIDRADAEWICFCDCDDAFSSIYSLKVLFYILREDPPYDLMWNVFYKNYLDADDTLDIEKEYNHVWIHNKYYRLSFLREHNIRFPEGIFMSEDSAFNNVVEMEIGENRIGQINTDWPLYCWLRRRGSVTTDPDRYYKNIEGHFHRNVWVLNEYRKRRNKRSPFVVARTLTDVYSFITRYPENFESDEYKRIIGLVSEFYAKEKGVYRNIKKEFKELALQASEKEAGVLGLNIPGKPTMKEWLKELCT